MKNSTPNPAPVQAKSKVGLAMRVNHWLRSHPSKWLYSDAVLRRWSVPNSYEVALMNRSWNGPVWDVGASIGKFTVPLATANPGHTVYAFEPNLNSIYYLAYRTARFSNVTLVPCALTADGKSIPGTFDPDFSAQATGPMSATLSVNEALAKFGPPRFIKLDVEGAEFSLIHDESPLRCATLYVEWHCELTGKAIPSLKGWKVEQLSPHHQLLTPRN